MGDAGGVPGLAARVFFGSRLARLCSLLMILVIAGALIGPVISPWDADAIDWEAIDEAPDARHWFGTDSVGRDLPDPNA